MFTQVRTARFSGEIVSQIVRAIVDGQLSSGDRLPSERELAEQFGVSRMTVRDALRVLEARGLIRIKVGGKGGLFVVDATADRVAESISTMLQLKRMTLTEIAEARKVVEGQLAELAAERADENDMRRLEEALVAGGRAIAETSSHLRASMDFHVVLAQAAHNEVLQATVRAYHELLQEALMGMRDQRSARSIQKAHEEMLEALRSRDGVALRELTVQHLAESEKRLRRWVQANVRSGARVPPAVKPRPVPLTARDRPVAKRAKLAATPQPGPDAAELQRRMEALRNRESA